MTKPKNPDLRLKRNNPTYGRCPTCHQPIIAADDIEQNLSPSETVILRFIRNSGAAGTNGKDIWNEMYGNRRNGGPASPNIIAVQIKSIKKKLEGSAIKIVTKGMGPHSKYIYERKE